MGIQFVARLPMPCAILHFIKSFVHLVSAGKYWAILSALCKCLVGVGTIYVYTIVARLPMPCAILHFIKFFAHLVSAGKYWAILSALCKCLVGVGTIYGYTICCAPSNALRHFTFYKILCAPCKCWQILGNIVGFVQMPRRRRDHICLYNLLRAFQCLAPFYIL